MARALHFGSAMHRCLVTALAAAAAVFASSTALADESPSPSAAASAPSYAAFRHQKKEREYWYGWQTLIADGAWMTAGLATSKASGNLGEGIAVGGYLLGGPIVHFANGNVVKGFADLGLRAGMPFVTSLVGFAVGMAASHGDGSWAALDGGAVGLVIGFVAGVGGAIAIDSAVHARGKHMADDADADDLARNGETPAFHAPAPKGLFVSGSLKPTLAPRKDVLGSSSVTGGMVGLSAMLY